MPFYEYECASCKFYTEVMQKISDPPLEKCPSCGKKALKKLVSAPVFRLKGGGWYETDFKSDKENKRNLAGAEREDSGSKSDDSASAAKPAADAKPAASSESSGSGSGSDSSSRSGGGKATAHSDRGKAGGKSAGKPAAAKASARKPKAKPAKSAARKK
jgi:putative FmdB family regulatory protein